MALTASTNKKEETPKKKKKRRPRNRDGQQQASKARSAAAAVDDSIGTNGQRAEQATKASSSGPSPPPSSQAKQLGKQKNIKQNSRKRRNGKKKSLDDDSTKANQNSKICSQKEQPKEQPFSLLLQQQQQQQPQPQKSTVQRLSLETTEVTDVQLQAAHDDDSTSKRLIEWPVLSKPVPVDVETAIIPTLIHWGKKGENGMMCRQPNWRVKRVKLECRNVGISLPAALSLRRLLIRSYKPPHYSLQRCGLGSEADVLQSATLFEHSVQDYLHMLGITHVTEDQQREAFKRENPGQQLRATPDFFLSGQESLYYNGAEQRIHWIEVKMFYGASSLMFSNNKRLSAVGSILQKAEKYVTLYGTGAFVFSFGCGAAMKDELAQRGVLVLDASVVNCDRMVNHQKTWCANDRGDVLP